MCTLKLFNTVYAQGISWGQLEGLNSRLRGQNFALNGAQEEVGVSLFFFQFSFSHDTKASCGDNLLPQHLISPAI